MVMSIFQKAIFKWKMPILVFELNRSFTLLTNQMSKLISNGVLLKQKKKNKKKKIVFRFNWTKKKVKRE